ncbi:1-(5-phosphoribosyl)-5-[(5-phosphoribosylamino)methylideneamino]imidazole-4-carboxamide isomerase [Buchnera aphidicola]|uniref:1-(5-phosphoribosyl)-5-[(5-phosphoribosylamino)methylideneamino] imidazole-4-carboxamide isomerase n=1 Tax=Buchnera aphidicola (Aphis gossypii) TaxID=98785 RepID=A0A5J6ZD35_9GAMM|nr:1-(5-phosphoribosyl)-5-[(5-phosphoribosylamino)methylideneamino]imidazole-4-carboxamide isomerase [Buchnera aphidicola]QFQ31953.1 1-(5-phosphoribosyl)-5-[(5-phosphoribosylamino)methylideneamino]imidazole-4-carboxamide isomerase [Buchnera aphidicola (Aphis gossypii)]UPT14485.1 1-(5-phosphoribosyl)-5-[(5-phosphoribosylamino)methylideneamino]imidazole-4-carboxamide isomerase [Buchnera aphidicola (Aphis gossypii)]
MIIPSFDFLEGKVVRLYQGNYLNKTFYNIDLYQHLRNLKEKGVKIVHLVDLNGAKKIEDRQFRLFQNIILSTNMRIQIGGGIRTENDINMLFDLGCARVVIGSSAIKNKFEVRRWLKVYGSDKIVLALDVNVINNKKKISINGWVKETNYTLEDTIDFFSSESLTHVLCTDISKDGTLSGPNIMLYKEIVKKFKHIKFQASGGVSNLFDVVALKKSGVDSIIIGRSLLEKRFTIEEALKCWQNVS